ncbi:MAG: alpha/beta hydrolase [Eggerthellaceae bacterium]|nr:alpha/beta hydrolase [Eggerthellaceae bacterium]
MNEEDFTCANREHTIWGRLYLPQGDGPFPLLIYSHGLGNNRFDVVPEDLARAGIALCVFDFCGGSPYSKSSGLTTEMSVMTEAEDLSAVLDFCKADGRFDKNRIYLSGNSQGGYVSTIVGIERQPEIRGIFLLCPAYLISALQNDAAAELFPDLALGFAGIELGSRYIEDIPKYPIFEHLNELKRPVTIYHGTSDLIAPVHYSELAVEILPNAQLIQIPGARHAHTHYASAISRDIIKKIQADHM